jgi:pimeloyl-ACP methyl ester carboxylesterase
MVLPALGPWPHKYYAIDDTFVEVAFEDTSGSVRRINVRHKALGDGPTLILVHGLMSSSYSWRYVLEPLSKRYRVLAPDLVGAGSTDKPLDLEYSVENVARFVAEYVRTVSREPVYLVGNSLGGLYCLRALLLDDGGPKIARRFVLMHSPGYPMLRVQAMSTLLGAPFLGSALARGVAQTAFKFPHAFVAKNVHYARKDMLCEEECAETGRLFETLEGAKVFARILTESLDPAEHARIIAELRDRKARGIPLPCPIRIIYARKDTLVPPSFGPLYHADLPGSELVWMDDTSHFLQCDQPEETVSEIFAFDRPASERPVASASRS